jgi:hypothetical protein
MERIAEQQVRTESGCLIWTGHLTKTTKNVNCLGYGKVRLDGKMVSVHRLIYAEKVGPIPPGADVLHTCDDTRCGEESHLFLGTNRDNIDDKCRKDRSGKKLCISVVSDIRHLAATGISQQKLAKRFGINQSNISRAVNAVRWAHVTPAGGV